MGMHEQIEDLTGIQEFVHNRNSMEDAGDGLIRIIRYMERRNGVLIPVCSTVAPALCVLRAAREAEDFMIRFLKEQSRSLIGH